MDNKVKKFREINAMDCFYTVVLKWRLILCVTLAFTILIGSYGVFLSTKEQSDKEETAKQVAATLTAEEASDVENAAIIINEYRKQYEAQKEYNSNSILQSLNALAIKEYVIDYYIDTDYRISYPVIEEANNTLPLVMAYATLLKDDSLYLEMNKTIDSTILPQYFEELVQVDISMAENGMLTVTIFGNDDLILQQMAIQIKNLLDSKIEEMVTIYDNHNLSIVSEKLVTSIEPSIYSCNRIIF